MRKQITFSESPMSTEYCYVLGFLGPRRSLPLLCLKDAVSPLADFGGKILPPPIKGENEGDFMRFRLVLWNKGALTPNTWIQ